LKPFGDSHKEEIRCLSATPSIREYTLAFSAPVQQYLENDRVAIEPKKFRRDVKIVLSEKPRVILRADNLPAWKDNTLADANLIDAKEILTEEQITPSAWMDHVEEALWKERSSELDVQSHDNSDYLQHH
jgi:hypothetical protein